MAKKKTKQTAVTEEGLKLAQSELEGEIVSCLNGYKQEAVQARKGGLNPRDDQWENNLNWYWRRADFSRKAAWQAKEVMPEVSGFVDRFAAALKEALVATPNGFYTVSHPAGDAVGIDFAVKRATDVWLSHCGTNQLGDDIGFPAVFEEQCKLGALMACASTVTWKTYQGYGCVKVENVDPRTIWLDHTGRGLYRIRQIEMDKHDLVKMAREADTKGQKIWNTEAISNLVTDFSEDTISKREELTGHGGQISSGRRAVNIDEYLATVVGHDGSVIADNALMVVANGKHLIRGPEKNPFWHGSDWIVYSPLITTPLSVYGKAYVEDFGHLAQTFNQMTNLILDAVQTSSIRAYAVVPSMLEDPSQLGEGVHPNKMFKLADGMTPDDFFKALELGTLPGESVQIWQALKNELMEAAARNEIGMGQFAPNSRTSATEVASTQQSTSAVVRSVAQTIESRFLNLLLDRVWKTGFQNVSVGDLTISRAIGPDMFGALMSRRKELVKTPFTFQASGISTLVQKNQMFRQIIQLFQVMGQSDLLMQAFLAVASPEKTMRLLFELSDVDLSKLSMSEQERMMRQFMPPTMAQPMVGPPTGPGAGAAMREAGGIARGLGVERSSGGGGGGRY